MPEKKWTVKDAVEYGVKMENRSIGFYTSILKVVKSPGAKQFIKEIITYNENYKRIFETTQQEYQTCGLLPMFYVGLCSFSNSK